MTPNQIIVGQCKVDWLAHSLILKDPKNSVAGFFMR